jgi:hypothetical protein
LFYLIEGLIKILPSTRFEFLSDKLKATTPPILIPHIYIFKFEYLFLILITNCSLIVTISSKDSRRPLSSPSDYPKFLKSYPVTTIPDDTNCLASSPHIPI